MKRNRFNVQHLFELRKAEEIRILLKNFPWFRTIFLGTKDFFEERITFKSSFAHKIHNDTTLLKYQTVKNHRRPSQRYSSNSFLRLRLSRIFTKFLDFYPPHKNSDPFLPQIFFLAPQIYKNFERILAKSRDKKFVFLRPPNLMWEKGNSNDFFKNIL